MRIAPIHCFNLEVALWVLFLLKFHLMNSVCYLRILLLDFRSKVIISTACCFLIKFLKKVHIFSIYLGKALIAKDVLLIIILWYYPLAIVRTIDSTILIYSLFLSTLQRCLRSIISTVAYHLSVFFLFILALRYTSSLYLSFLNLLWLQATSGSLASLINIYCLKLRASIGVIGTLSLLWRWLLINLIERIWLVASVMISSSNDLASRVRLVSVAIWSDHVHNILSLSLGESLRFYKYLLLVEIRQLIRYHLDLVDILSLKSSTVLLLGNKVLKWVDYYLGELRVLIPFLSIW